MIQDLFTTPIEIHQNKIIFSAYKNENTMGTQFQTQEIFSTKWDAVNKMEELPKLYEDQFKWFLSLYGFETLEHLKDFLKDKMVIIDTGCGLGYKSWWLSQLAPHAAVIGIDISDAVDIAAEKYKEIKNLYFLKCDIADTKLKNNSCDFVLCDQVIMHTQNPKNTFSHLAAITSEKGEFACYFYRKKALPRELIDDYFRSATLNIPDDQMWAFSEQLTELGKRLSALNVSFESPDIPLLGIKGGSYDIQRFIYWNFLKCFWKEDWGFDLCKSTNYDWYAPSNAQRFSQNEVMEMVKENNLQLQFWHEEEACYSLRVRPNGL